MVVISPHLLTKGWGGAAIYQDSITYLLWNACCSDIWYFYWVHNRCWVQANICRKDESTPPPPPRLKRPTAETTRGRNDPSKYAESTQPKIWPKQPTVEATHDQNNPDSGVQFESIRCLPKFWCRLSLQCSL